MSKKDLQNYIDASKIKTFNLCDLVGRTVAIRCFMDSSERIQLLMAFDARTHESFIISIENVPRLGVE